MYVCMYLWQFSGITHCTRCDCVCVRFVCVFDAVFDGTPRHITTYIGVYEYVLVIYVCMYSRLQIGWQKIFLKLSQRTRILPIITVLVITWYS